GNTPGVKHLPELLSHTYRNRVPKPSNSNRNPSVKHEPESHSAFQSWFGSNMWVKRPETDGQTAKNAR
ncbi:hypothetical protein, partial [Mycobacterium marinum]|uniref:hypothetical protein n=1 Tax=Mycobacterium marinum TaxID=1781 RepID=UPI001AA06F0A